MDELARIQAFIRVVEAGSFSAAARESSSTSSLARQVKSLEEELGVCLLNRNTRSLSLTEPGRRFYGSVCAVANDLNRAKSEAKSFHNNVKGMLRVSLRISAGLSIIVPALPAFVARYPDLQLEIALTDEKLDLISHNIDVAVWLGALPDSEFLVKKLCPTQRIVCAAPAYLDRFGIPEVPGDLRTHDCLLFTGRQYRSTWEFTRDGYHDSVAVKGSLRTDSSAAMLSATLAGLGIMVLSEWEARLSISEGRLVQVLGGYDVNPGPGNAELNVVYSSSRRRSRNVRAFVDFLENLFCRGSVANDPGAASTVASQHRDGAEHASSVNGDDVGPVLDRGTSGRVGAVPTREMRPVGVPFGQRHALAGVDRSLATRDGFEALRDDNALA